MAVRIVFFARQREIEQKLWKEAGSVWNRWSLLVGVGMLACFDGCPYILHAFSVGKTSRRAPFCTHTYCMLDLALVTMLDFHALGAQLGQNRDEEESAGGPRRHSH